MDTDTGDQQSCEITGTLGFIVQGILGVLAFAILIVKRHFEKPKRQVKIWMLDTSKQGFSQMIAHILNVILAVMLSSEQSDDPCDWYFVTILFDTTIGVFICYIILLITEKVFDKIGVGRLKTGNYFRIYTPDELMALDEFNRRSDQLSEDKSGLNLIRPVIKIDFCIWGSQVVIWVLVVIVSKTILYFIQLSMATFLKSIAAGIFSGLNDSPNLKLIFVMVLIPLFLNCIQFWVQDNFLKKSEFTKVEQQFLTSEMFVNLELQDMLNNDYRNEDYDGQATVSSSHNHNAQSSSIQNNHNNSTSKDNNNFNTSPKLQSKNSDDFLSKQSTHEYEFQQYNNDNAFQ